MNYICVCVFLCFCVFFFVIVSCSTVWGFQKTPNKVLQDDDLGTSHSWVKLGFQIQTSRFLIPWSLRANAMTCWTKCRVCIFQINCLSQGPDLRPEPYMISNFLKVMDYVSLFQVTVQYLDHKYSNAVLE